MKVFLVLFVFFAASVAVFGLYQDDSQEQHIDEWAKQSVQLFKESARFFSSIETDVDTPPKVDSLDEKLQTLLPSENVDLDYKPDFEETLALADSQTSEISSDALLPNLFAKQEKSGTSVKGQIFTDEEDNIIGAEVQLAIPTDM